MSALFRIIARSAHAAPEPGVDVVRLSDMPSKRRPQPDRDLPRNRPQDAISPGVLPAGTAIVIENDPRLQQKSETEKELEEDVEADRKQDD